MEFNQELLTFEEYAKTSEIKLFVSHANLYQIAIPNTEIRINRWHKKKLLSFKEKAYDDLFSALFIDFEHSLHKNIRKTKNHLVCVMKNKDCR